MVKTLRSCFANRACPPDDTPQQASAPARSADNTEAGRGRRRRRGTTRSAARVRVRQGQGQGQRPPTAALTPRPGVGSGGPACGAARSAASFGSSVSRRDCASTSARKLGSQ